MENFVIRTQQLSKIFASRENGKTVEVQAVAGIDLEVSAGEIFGLLGPNGAGKTTAMRMLCTLLTPTSGSAQVAGFDLRSQHEQIREHIGYVSQRGGMERRQTGRENLLLSGGLYGIERRNVEQRASEVIDRLGLTSFADRRASTYSGGQRRIFDLAAGIIHKPKLLFLDEPTTGLDPQSRTKVWDEVKKIHEERTAIFVTTHYLEEADVLCDRVAIVDHGKIVSMGKPSELKRQMASDRITLGFDSNTVKEKALPSLKALSFVKEIKPKELSLYVYVDNGDETLPLIMNELHRLSIPIKTIQLARPTLDDVFLKLTGRTMRETEQETGESD